MRRFVIPLYLFVGCTPSQSKETVILAAILPQTGSSPAPSWTTAAKIAVDDANAGLTQAGSALQIEMKAADSTGAPVVSAQRAIELVGQGAKMIITELSSNDQTIHALNYSQNPAEEFRSTLLPAEPTPLNVPIVCIQCTSTALNRPDFVGTDSIAAANRNEDGYNFRVVPDQGNEVVLETKLCMTGGPNGDGDRNGDGVVKMTTIQNDDSPGTAAGGAGSYAEGNPLHDTYFKPGSFTYDVKQYNPNAIIEVLYLPATIADSNNPPVPWGDVYRYAVDNVSMLWLPTADCPIPTASGNTCAPMNATASKPQCASTLCSDYVNYETPSSSIVDVVPDVLTESTRTNAAIATVSSWNNDKSAFKPTYFHLHGFRNPGALLNLGSAINGQEGVSSPLVDASESGTIFSDEVRSITGLAPQYTDSMAYDAAMTLALATALASSGLAHPGEVTPDAIRDAMKKINDPAGIVIRPGRAEFAKAVAAFKEGKAINYAGASGPVDFDEHGNVRGNLVHYRGENANWAEIELFDCVSDPSCPKAR